MAARAYKAGYHYQNAKIKLQVKALQSDDLWGGSQSYDVVAERATRGTPDTRTLANQIRGGPSALSLAATKSHFDQSACSGVVVCF